MNEHALLGISIDPVTGKPWEFNAETPAGLEACIRYIENVRFDLDNNARKMARLYVSHLKTAENGKNTIFRWATNQVRFADDNVYGVAAGATKPSTTSELTFWSPATDPNPGVTNTQNGKIQDKYVAFFGWAVRLDIGTGNDLGEETFTGNASGESFDSQTSLTVLTTALGVTTPSTLPQLKAVINGELTLQTNSTVLIQNMAVEPVFRAQGSATYRSDRLYQLSAPFWVDNKTQMEFKLRSSDPINPIAKTTWAKAYITGGGLIQAGNFLG